MENKKIYGGLVLLAVAEDAKPKKGECVTISKLDTEKDPLAFGIKRIDRDIYLAQKANLLDQVVNYNLEPAENFSKIFLSKKVDAKVVDVIDISLANGKECQMAVIEAEVPEMVENTSKEAKTVTTNTVKMGFAGTKSEFPHMEAIAQKLVNNEMLTNLTVKFENDTVILFQEGKPVGKAKGNVEKQLKSSFKNVEGKDIPATFNRFYSGIIEVEFDEKELKIDTESLFKEEVAYAKTLGMTDEEIESYIDLMLYYGIEAGAIKAVIKKWKQYPSNVESRIPMLTDAIKEIKGKKYYSFIDGEELIHDLVSWQLADGQYNIRLIGEMSTGKNLAIKTVATLFRKPVFRLDLTGYSDDSVILGNTTINENGIVTYQKSLVMQAMEAGAILVLDEINMAAPDVLTALNPLLEQEDGTLDLKELGVVRPTEGFQVFATMNCNGDNNLYAGTKDINGALESRFTTIHLKAKLDIKDVLINKCLDASKQDIEKISNVYKSLAIIVADPTRDFPDSFVALRAYVDILNGPKSISLKKRCIQKLACLKTGDTCWEEVVETTINDIFGK